MKASEILILNGLGTKKQVKKMIKRGEVFFNGSVLNEDRDIEDGLLSCHQDILDIHPLKYLMLNKPAGYVSANKDAHDPVITDLLPDMKLSIAGRLDKETTGLVLLTNDQKLRKKLILPAFHIPRTYHFKCAEPLDELNLERFKAGIVIDKKVRCERTSLTLLNEKEGYITLHEGKYHEVRKMFLSIDNKIVALERISYGPIRLDVPLGCYRSLKEEEIQALYEEVNHDQY